MSENKIEYIIVCLNGVTSYDYEYSSDSFMELFHRLLKSGKHALQKKVNKLMKELGISAEDVEKLIKKK